MTTQKKLSEKELKEMIASENPFAVHYDKIRNITYIVVSIGIIWLKLF